MHFRSLFFNSVSINRFRHPRPEATRMVGLPHRHQLLLQSKHFHPNRKSPN